MSAIRPILTSLLRHKGAVVILVVEVALTCAILCNAFDLISRRIADIRLPTGVDEAHLVRILGAPLVADSERWAQTDADIATLRSVPGVANVSLLSQVPLQQGSNNSGVTTSPDSKSDFTSVGLTMGDEGVLNTLGVKLTAGRAFTADDFIKVTNQTEQPQFRNIIITQALADKLYPGTSAIGKPLYMGRDNPLQIIGIVDKLMRPGGWMGYEARQYSMVIPVRTPIDFFGQYLIRVKEGSDPQSVLKNAVSALNKAYPRRIITESKTFAEMRQDYYANDRSMAWMLGTVAMILLLVTAVGIVGLASFWVQQRTKQIGVRRALGATRGDILRYFQTENFLIVTIGIVLGMVLAFALNQLLMSKYEMPRLPWMYLPVGAVILWVLGQISVLAPAMRAAAIPPATATRSV